VVFKYITKYDHKGTKLSQRFHKGLAQHHSISHPKPSNQKRIPDHL
jgi:hypothetical protein